MRVVRINFLFYISIYNFFNNGFIATGVYFLMELEKFFQNAISYHQSGDVDQALRIYRWLATSIKDNAHLLYFHGLAECQAGNQVTGIRLIHDSIRLSPENSEAYFNLGLIQFKLAKYHDAIKDFLKLKSV